MREVEEFVIVRATLRRDHESRRWYGVGGSACLVLTTRGRLLEPYPTFGPSSYRLLSRRVGFGEADAYAIAHGYRHLRVLDALQPPRLN